MPRLNRKGVRGMKKLALSLCAFVLGTGLWAIDVSLHIHPSYELPLNNFLNKAGGFGVNAGLDITPVNIRIRDKLYITGQFSFAGYPVDGFGLQPFLDGGLGVGYSMRFSDRFAAFGEGVFGVWNFPGATAFSTNAPSGISFSGKLGVDFFVSPALSVTGFAGFKSVL